MATNLDPSRTGPNPLPMSAVIKAASGIEHCRWLNDPQSAATRSAIEIVVADGSGLKCETVSSQLKHIRVDSVFDPILGEEGIKHASNEWVVVIEDHGLPFPGLLEAYRQAILENPTIDLFSGALENTTSTSDWSFASFLIGNYERWPQTGLRPRRPTVANFAIRKSALSYFELSDVGGVQVAAFERLAAEGRFMYCPLALVDHQYFAQPGTAFAKVFYWGSQYAFLFRKLRRSRGVPIEIVRGIARIAYHTFIRPFTTLAALRGTEQFRLSHLHRFAFLGFAHSLGTLYGHVFRPAIRNL